MSAQKFFIGQKFKGTNGITKNKVGDVIRFNDDLVTLDFGNDDTYGISLSRFENFEFEELVVYTFLYEKRLRKLKRSSIC